MPGRITPLITNEIYHCLNRGIAKIPIYLHQKDYNRFIDTLCYYQNTSTPLPFSDFLKTSEKIRISILKKMEKDEQKYVDIIAFCLMPNHFHLLLKQLKEDGISIFMSKISNSYTKYFNSKNKKDGPILSGKFKNILIESDEQLLHVQRYIHLNPYSGALVKSINNLETYPFSSLPQYLTPKENNFCSSKFILDYFKSPADYKNFFFDQANYQKRLQFIKHLVLEE